MISSLIYPPSHALNQHRCLRRWQQSSPFTPNPIGTAQHAAMLAVPSWLPASLCWILAPLSSQLSAVSATLIGMWHQSLSVLLWLTCCKDSTVIRFSVHESSTVSTAISHSHNPSSLPQWATSWACLRSWRWATHHESGAPEAQMPYRCWALGICPRAGLQVHPLQHYNQENQFNFYLPQPILVEHPHHLFPCPFLLPTPLMMWACSHVKTKPTSDSDEVNPSVLCISNSPVWAFRKTSHIIPLHLLLQPIVHTLLIHCATPPLFPHGFQSLSIFPASWTTDTAGL